MKSNGLNKWSKGKTKKKKKVLSAGLAGVSISIRYGLGLEKKEL